MSRTARLLTPLAVAMLALPAMAGSWPNLPARKAAPAIQAAKAFTAVAPRSADGFVPEAGDAVSSLEQYRYFRTEETPNWRTPAPIASKAVRAPVDVATGKVNGFEYLGGDAGWQPISHTLVWEAGRFAHSDECDHRVRIVKGPTPEELESVRRAYPAS